MSGAGGAGGAWRPPRPLGREPHTASALRSGPAHRQRGAGSAFLLNLHKACGLGPGGSGCSAPAKVTQAAVSGAAGTPGGAKEGCGPWQVLYFGLCLIPVPHFSEVVFLGSVLAGAGCCAQVLCTHTPVAVT